VRVSVIGGGIMGSGIAQVAAMAGHDTRLYDVSAVQLSKARGSIDTSLGRFERKGSIDAAGRAAVWERLTLVEELEEATRGAEIVVEAVPEVLELKCEVLQAAEASAAEGALIATNTSQLSVSTIAAALRAPELCVGLHFFNPPVMMKLVEIVAGVRTSDETLARAQTLATSLGKETVVCRKDRPGFITTRVYVALRLECLRILEEGIASVEDIDKAMRLAFGFPMGPLELGDFNGLDTNLRVMDALSAAYGDRFRPPELLRAMVAANLLGRKTGEGFYRYDSDEAAENG